MLKIQLEEQKNSCPRNPAYRTDMIKIGIEMNILFRNLITSNRLYNLTAIKRMIMIGTLIHMAIKST